MSRPDGSPLRVLVGYDASPQSMHAVEAAARLIPEAEASVVHLWHTPASGAEVRERLAARARTLAELVYLMEQENQAEAERVAGYGATIARAAGWEAEPLAVRSYGGEGYQLARLAEQHSADIIVLGSRGLSGTKALLGSTSDVVVHVSSVPVLVVPPLTAVEQEVLDKGPAMVAVDGSRGAAHAAATCGALFPDRNVVPVKVECPGEPSAAAGDVEALRVISHGRSGSARAIAATLNEYGAELGASLLAVGSRGRSASRELLLGSVAKAVLHHAHRPVLVVPAAPVS